VPGEFIAAAEDFDLEVLRRFAVYDDSGVPLVEWTLHLGCSSSTSKPDAFNSGFGRAAHNRPRSRFLPKDSHSNRQHERSASPAVNRAEAVFSVEQISIRCRQLQRRQRQVASVAVSIASFPRPSDRPSRGIKSVSPTKTWVDSHSSRISHRWQSRFHSRRQLRSLPVPQKHSRRRGEDAKWTEAHLRFVPVLTFVGCESTSTGSSVRMVGETGWP
jgi:hypothetical protein